MIKIQRSCEDSAPKFPYIYIMDKIDPSAERMYEAMQRSGYLMESELAILLSSRYYFVESNQSVLDKETGKSREFDILASTCAQFQLDNKPLNSWIKLAIEVKNNAAPMVLLTPIEFSKQHQGYDIIKHSNGTNAEFSKRLKSDPISEILYFPAEGIMSQYCSFAEKKKDTLDDKGKRKEVKELMAAHPDSMHDGISKIIQYCDEQIDADNFVRKNGKLQDSFLYLPVLYINENLFELHTRKGGKHEFEKVDRSVLHINYHHKGKRTSAFVHVVTKEGLSGFLMDLHKLQQRIIEFIQQKNGRIKIH